MRLGGWTGSDLREMLGRAPESGKLGSGCWTPGTGLGQALQTHRLRARVPEVGDLVCGSIRGTEAKGAVQGLHLPVQSHSGPFRPTLTRGRWSHLSIAVFFNSLPVALTLVNSLPVSQK